MATQIKSITEKTLVPITMVIAVLGAALWLSNIYFLANNNAENINDLQSRVEAFVNANSDLIERFAKLETKIDILIDKNN